jgi:hypothetical protein
MWRWGGISAEAGDFLEPRRGRGNVPGNGALGGKHAGVK